MSPCLLSDHSTIVSPLSSFPPSNKKPRGQCIFADCLQTTFSISCLLDTWSLNTYRSYQKISIRVYLRHWILWMNVYIYIHIAEASRIHRCIWMQHASSYTNVLAQQLPNRIVISQANQSRLKEPEWRPCCCCFEGRSGCWVKELCGEGNVRMLRINKCCCSIGRAAVLLRLWINDEEKEETVLLSVSAFR